MAVALDQARHRVDLRVLEARVQPHTPHRHAEFARALHAEENVTVLPGTFLSRAAHRHGEALGSADDPGRNRVRMALVAGVDECVEAAQRIVSFIQSQSA